MRPDKLQSQFAVRSDPWELAAMSELDWADINSKLPFSRDEEEAERRKDLWAGIDVNGNGFVSLSEVTTVRLCSGVYQQH